MRRRRKKRNTSEASEWQREEKGLEQGLDQGVELAGERDDICFI